MKTHTITTYTFDELSESAKETARDRVRYDDVYYHHEENTDSLEGFAKWVGGKANWSVSLTSYSSASVKIDDDSWGSGWSDENGEIVFTTPELSNGPLLIWLKEHTETIYGDCPFTGYCMDEDLLDPMREYLGKSNPDDPRTLQDLVDEGVASWLKSYIADWKHSYTDEAIDEYFEANEYEFRENGEIY